MKATTPASSSVLRLPGRWLVGAALGLLLVGLDPAGAELAKGSPTSERLSALIQAPFRTVSVADLARPSAEAPARDDSGVVVMPAFQVDSRELRLDPADTVAPKRIEVDDVLPGTGVVTFHGRRFTVEVHRVFGVPFRVTLRW